MITVSVLYPSTPDDQFNMDYYFNQHSPLVHKSLGNALKKAEIVIGLSGMAPGSKPAYTLICHLFFDSVDAFQTAIAPHADAILGDIKKFTKSQPVIQISEVKNRD